MESKSSIYIFGKSCFLDLAKGPCGGNLRKWFKLCVMAKGCSVCSSERRRQQWSVPVFLIYLGQCSIFILERNVLNISWSLSWNGRHESDPTTPKRARLLFNTFTLSRTHVFCHDYCQVPQLRLHWENAEIFPIFWLWVRADVKSKWQIKKLLYVFFGYQRSSPSLLWNSSELANVHTRLPKQFNFVDFVVALACSKTIFFVSIIYLFLCVGWSQLKRNLTTIASCLHIASMTTKQNHG